MSGSSSTTRIVGEGCAASGVDISMAVNETEEVLIRPFPRSVSHCPLFNDKNPAGYRAASSASRNSPEGERLDAGSQPTLLCRLFAIDIQSDLLLALESSHCPQWTR